MKPHRKAVLVFLRHPEAGQVKKRLAATIGAEKALHVYLKTARRTLGLLCDLKEEQPGIDLFVFFTPCEKEAEVRNLFSGPWEFVGQKGTHLGLRMENAFGCAFARGYEQVLLVGSDIIDLEIQDFLDGFSLLEDHPSVLGPACDGGFYLIGLRTFCRAPFSPSQWGGEKVFSRTEDLLARSGFAPGLLPRRTDADRSRDLPVFYRDPMNSCMLSVIIPTLRPLRHLSPLLSRLERLLWPGDEIVVALGSSSPPGSADIWNERTRAVSCPTGRGIQLNHGAAAARGDLLLFLHEDSVVPSHLAYLVRKLCREPGYSLGCFRLGFHPSSSFLDWIARWANFRTRFFHLPYGDQGFFCRRETFDRVGGFRKPFLMEDVDFVRRCRRIGPILVLREKIRTSPRRYLAGGVLATALQNHLILLLHQLGVSDEKLYSLYYGRKPTPYDLPREGALGHGRDALPPPGHRVPVRPGKESGGEG
ncbi:MAG TPA: TIGR04283 family arsenosugar biosynthesis glycosyltransferase [Syntrophobacteraceae bacterium]|nr:TIGR04283 family arsenosugar biosynthesis glycosyltransferase [Syntrophobacteraceae bacterium]